MSQKPTNIFSHAGRMTLSVYDDDDERSSISGSVTGSGGGGGRKSSTISTRISTTAGKRKSNAVADTLALPMNRTSNRTGSLPLNTHTSMRFSNESDVGAALRLHNAAAQLAEADAANFDATLSSDDEEVEEDAKNPDEKVEKRPSSKETRDSTQSRGASKFEKMRNRHAQENEMKQVFALAQDNEENMNSVMPVAQVFCLLDEMFRKGKLSYSRVAILKGKYQLLMDALRRKKEHYNRVLGNIRRQNEDITTFRKEVKRAERLPDSSKAECDRHRRDLQRIHDNLKESKEREDQLGYEIAELNAELVSVNKQKEKVPEPEAVTKRIKELSNDRDILRAEIITMRQKKQTAMHQLEEKIEEIDNIQLHHEKEKESVNEAHAAIETLSSQPAQLSQENEKERVMHHHLTQSLATTTITYNEHAKSLETNNRDIARLYDKKRNCEEQARKRLRVLQQKQELYDNIYGELQKTRDEETYMAQERHQIERDKSDTEVQLRIASDALKRRVKERDIDLRFLRSLEKQARYAVDYLKSTKLHFSNAAAVLKEWRANLADKRELALQATKASDANKKRTRLDAEHLTSVEMMMRKLRREMQRTADMREHTERRWTRANDTWWVTEMDLHGIRIKLRNADVLRQRYYDLNRRRKIDHREATVEAEHLTRVLAQFVSRHHQMERDKADMATQLAGKRAKIETINEKNSLFKGELDVLRVKAQDKEKELVNERARFVSLMFERDALRMDLLKHRNEVGELRATCGHKRAATDRLKRQIELICARCEDLHASIERLMRARNDTALKIHDVQSETCVVAERVNCLSDLNEKGHLAILQLTEIVKVYTRAATELRTTVLNLVRVFPESKIMTLQVAQAKMQTIDAVDANIRTELALEQSTHKRETIRFLPGVDPSMKQLELKCRQLEKKLFEKDVNSIKSELQLEHLDRVLVLAESERKELKKEQLDPAIVVMSLRKQLEKLTGRERMLVIDVNLAKNTVKQNEEQSDNVESFVLNIKRILAEGQTTDNIPETFLRLLKLDRERTRVKTKQSNDGSGDTSLAQSTATNGRGKQRRHGKSSFSSATKKDFSRRKPIEIRPNCYYPKIGDRLVLIPVPYSKYAPFKPYGKNHQLARHYRKPKRKIIAPLLTVERELAMSKSEDAWLNVLDWLHAKEGANGALGVSPTSPFPTSPVANNPDTPTQKFHTTADEHSNLQPLVVERDDAAVQSARPSERIETQNRLTTAEARFSSKQKRSSRKSSTSNSRRTTSERKSNNLSADIVRSSIGRQSELVKLTESRGPSAEKDSSEQNM